MKLYLILAMRRPQLDPAVIPQHAAFLDGLRAEGRSERSGPFGDKSGGAFLLHAVDMDEALAIAHRDPAFTSGGWEITVHEWQAR